MRLKIWQKGQDACLQRRGAGTTCEQHVLALKASVRTTWEYSQLWLSSNVQRRGQEQRHQPLSISFPPPKMQKSTRSFQKCRNARFWDDLNAIEGLHFLLFIRLLPLFRCSQSNVSFLSSIVDGSWRFEIYRFLGNFPLWKRISHLFWEATGLTRQELIKWLRHKIITELH